MKRFVKIAGLVFITFIILTSAVYAFAMPQATRSLFIDAYDFKKDGNLYFRSNVNPEKISVIQSTITMARERNRKFWGKSEANPKFIYCDTDEDYRKFGSSLMTPAATHLSFKSYVAIGNDGIDLDILAHEISHTELSERIGLINRILKIPVWFDEGLAMQVDYRSGYSLDTLAIYSNNYKNLPDVKSMKASQFWNGTKSEVRMHYMTAKYQVRQWYSKKNLESLIDRINKGKSFQEAFLATE